VRIITGNYPSICFETLPLASPVCYYILGRTPNEAGKTMELYNTNIITHITL
jgi:hypothetical protein